jgi:SAM-dependent methyltransferase
MMDIGGGGGFFSKAFESLGFGESTYVDLDPQSCDFARDTLGLERVFNCDAMDMRKYASGNFDLIYCRHVVEHLLDPTSFMERILGYLKDDGIFVVQVPNGHSLEYLAYPKSTIRKRISVICRTNDLSLLKVFWIMISGGMLHGIDPPRHLWAITREGMKRWADGKGVKCDIHTHHLGDPAYSPYYRKGKGLRAGIQDLIGQRILGPIHGGTHLVAVLRH